MQRIVAHLRAQPQPPRSADVARTELCCAALSDGAFDAAETLLPVLQAFGWTAGEYVAGQFVDQLDAAERAHLAMSLKVGVAMATELGELTEQQQHQEREQHEQEQQTGRATFQWRSAARRDRTPHA